MQRRARVAPAQQHRVRIRSAAGAQEHAGQAVALLCRAAGQLCAEYKLWEGLSVGTELVANPQLDVDMPDIASQLAPPAR